MKRLCILFFGGIFMLHSMQCFSQRPKGHRRANQHGQEDFLSKQFWIGLKGGANLTKAVPIHRYSTFSSSVNPGGHDFDKTYKNFSNIGGQGGLEITFAYRMISLSFQPGYRRYIFSYGTSFTWTDPSNSSNTLQQNTQAAQKLDYFEFPLFFRFSPLKTKLKPFVQAGAFYSRLNNAIKSTKVTSLDQASGGSNAYVSQDISVGAKDLFIKSNLGWSVGAGVSYPLGNARLALEFNYFRNTHNITNIANRFRNDLLTGSGDVLDDIKLRNLSLSLSILMPLRFVVLKENYKFE